MTTTKFDTEAPPKSPYECRPIAVEARDGLCIWIEFSDGKSGDLDLSHLKGKGVFTAWDDRAFFDGVHINEFGDVSWGFYDDSEMEMDFCSYTLYHRLTGIPFEELLTGFTTIEE